VHQFLEQVLNQTWKLVIKKGQKQAKDQAVVVMDELTN
jgi:hypothetical protein